MMQLLTNGIALFTFAKKVGKRPLFVMGSIGLTIANWIIAFALLFKIKILILIMMALFMLFYGATFLPISWSYPS